MLNSKKYPKDSTERLINEKLGELIQLCKNQIFTAEFKQTPEFFSEDCELDTLGIIVSKYCDWDGNAIEKVSLSAFEDSNFTANIDF